MTCDDQILIGSSFSPSPVVPNLGWDGWKDSRTDGYPGNIKPLATAITGDEARQCERMTRSDEPTQNVQLPSVLPNSYREFQLISLLTGLQNYIHLAAKEPDMSLRDHQQC